MRQYESFAIIIYVTEIEKNAVMRMYDWNELKVEGDNQEYMETYVERGERKLHVICARQDEMGMTASAALTAKMISLFVPKYVIMPGIAAGTGNFLPSEDQIYGDVVLAQSVWNYSNGKYVSPQDAEIVFGEVGFLPRPTKVDIKGDFIEKIQKFIESDQNEFHVQYGPLASGTAVVANASMMKKQVMKSFKNTKGVEMEGYGVAYAANHALEPKPFAIIAKSVCDFADERKNDKYQKFAAYTSCGFVKELINHVLD